MEDEIMKEECKMFALRDRIMERADKMGITLRIMGGVAVRTHCPFYKYLHYNWRRRLPDIDFVGYLKEVTKIQELFLNLGFEEDKVIMRLFGTQRRIFNLVDENIRADVVLDKLRFCHEIDLRQRLTLDYPTITLADLLISKLQIIKIDLRDILDITMLLLEHEIGDNNNETIDMQYISGLCARDWGLWKTVTINLSKILNVVEKSTSDKKDAMDVKTKVEHMLRVLRTCKKSIKWRLRSCIGERIKWYREVDELEVA